MHQAQELLDFSCRENRFSDNKLPRLCFILRIIIHSLIPPTIQFSTKTPDKYDQKATHLLVKLKPLSYTVVRELRVHELSQTDLVTLYQLHLLVWENYYIVYVHLISLRGILLYKIHYKICLSFRATCKGLLKHGIEK